MWNFICCPNRASLCRPNYLPSSPLNFIPVSSQVYPSHVFKSMDLFKSGIRSNRALYITSPPFKIAPNRSVAQKSYLIQSQVQRDHCNFILPGMDQNRWEAHHFLLFLGSDQFIDRGVLVASKNDLATIEPVFKNKTCLKKTFFLWILFCWKQHFNRLKL